MNVRKVEGGYFVREISYVHAEIQASHSGIIFSSKTHPASTTPYFCVTNIKMFVLIVSFSMYKMLYTNIIP